MDVTIYYSKDFNAAPGGIERISTPLESGLDRNRVCFRQDTESPDVWYLALEKFTKNKSEEADWTKQAFLLAVKCGGMADYEAYLEKNVDLIEVDGRTFWANPSLKGGDEQ